MIETFPSLTDDLRAESLSLLATRPAWAGLILQAVDYGRVDPKSIPGCLVQRLQRFRDPAIAARVAKHFGDVRASTPAELQLKIDRLGELIRQGAVDPRCGEATFVARFAGCHARYGRGGNVGPDLTSYRRDDLDAMLLSFVAPGAEICEG